jgi:ABC-type lipoprotein release transport system permease subunit
MKPGMSTPAVRSLAGLCLRVARQWWPHLAALAAASGIVAATISGALGVGNAIQSGLRRLALARLGGIEAAVMADGFFRVDLAAETAAHIPPSAGAKVVPALVLEVSLEAAGDAGRRVGGPVRATLLACDESAALGFVPSAPTPEADEVAINGPLAESLGVVPGDAVVLRISKAGGVPADSPLGRRTADSWSRRLRVASVLPAGGIGVFSLRPTQGTGPRAVTSLGTARATLRRDAPVANALLAVAGADVAGTGAGAARPVNATAGQRLADGLRDALRPTLADLGLAFDTPRGSGAWRLESSRLILPPEADRAAAEVLAPLGGHPTLAFLANSLTPLVDGRAGSATIPYSTVVGIDASSLPVGDLVDDDGSPLQPPGADEIVIDRWMADDLVAQGTPVAVGDAIELRSFLPETLHGRVEEAACTLRISGIAAMRGAAVARDLVPEVEGITDEASITDWDPPFPFDRSRVRATPPHDEDVRYWKQSAATPPAFVSLEVARRLAGSRFGRSTAWHVPRERVQAADEVRAAVAAAARPQLLGMRVVPLRPQAEAAARGATPFGSLFLALSSFVVAAGLLLEWLLFSLLGAARRRDVGILAAIGWPARRVALLLLGVGGVAAVVGIVAGTFLGPPWAQLLLGWLAGAWNTGVAAGSSAAFGEAASAFTPQGLAAMLPGAVAAAAVSLAAVAAAAWRAARLPPLPLLKGGGDPTAARRRAGAVTIGMALLMPAAAVALAWWGRRADAQAAVGLFFGAGFAALAGLLAWVRMLLGPAAGGHSLRTLPDLAWSGLRNGRSRAFSVAAIVACAEFLIVAVSAFALHSPQRPQDRDSPTGGWTFIASFGTPTGVDPTDASVRETLGLSDADRAALAGSTITRIRSNSGDDASCVNLYAPSEPTVLGLGPSFIDRGGFRFVDHAKASAAVRDFNPWTLLNGEQVAPSRGPAAAAQPQETPQPASPGTSLMPVVPVIPVIMDQATAQWALKLGGVGSRFELAVDGGRATLEIVGLLEPGILQGYVLVAEKNFERLFPSRSGYSLALVDAGPSAAAAVEAEVAHAVAAAWADAGVTVIRATDRLRSLQAVQNTFLAGFQALGTLGLVLGTAGVAAVQFQSVLERLGALGLMQAVGFTAGRLRQVVVLETLMMVVLGLVVGTLSGGLALAPAFMAGRAGVPAGWIACTWLLTLAAAVVAGLAAARRVATLQPWRALTASD